LAAKKAATNLNMPGKMAGALGTKAWDSFIKKYSCKSKTSSADLAG
jgi:hypothetical protein